MMLAVSLAGTTFQTGTGCGGTLLRNVNPCGTILVCDPLEYDLTFIDYFPNWNIDPTCTIPGLCGGTPFPPVPAQSATGGGALVGTTGGTTGGAAAP